MNVFKAIIVATVFCVLFVCCSGTVDNSSASSSNPAASPSAVQNKLKITVSLPDGWSPVQGSVLEHQYMKETASFMIKEERSLGSRSLDDAISEVKQQIGKYFENVDFTAENVTKVDGYDARSITFTYAVKVAGMAMSMKMQSVYVMVDQRCQNISFGDASDKFDALSSDIQQILQGIKFVE